MQPDLRVNRACTASACMGLISPRDFVDVILTKETDSYISTNGKANTNPHLNMLPVGFKLIYSYQIGHYCRCNVDII